MTCLDHGGFLAKAKHLRTAVGHCKPALPEARPKGCRPGSKTWKGMPAPLGNARLSAAITMLRGRPSQFVPVLLRALAPAP
jgi:hypothetical protein